MATPMGFCRCTETQHSDKQSSEWSSGSARTCVGKLSTQSNDPADWACPWQPKLQRGAQQARQQSAQPPLLKAYVQRVRRPQLACAHEPVHQHRLSCMYPSASIAHTKQQLHPGAHALRTCTGAQALPTPTRCCELLQGCILSHTYQPCQHISQCCTQTHAAAWPGPTSCRCTSPPARTLSKQPRPIRQERRLCRGPPHYRCTPPPN
jgi:hypothetical protein